MSDAALAYWYELSVSRRLAHLDLRRTPIQLVLSTWWQRQFDEGFKHCLVPIMVLLLFGDGCSLYVLFCLDGHFHSAMLGIIALCVVIMLVLFCTLSLDVLQLLIHEYEFWFITVFDSLYWVCLGLVFRDTRVLMCVYGWLHLQMVIVVDANLRFMRETVLSAWISTPGILILATLAAFDKFPYQKESPIVLFGQALGDATDALSLTATTLFIFLFKIVVLKRRSVIPASLQSSSSLSSMVIPCVVVKSTIRLQPTTRKYDSFGSKRRPSLTIRPHQLAVTQINAFNTVLPVVLWSLKMSARRRSLRLVFYLCGFLGYLLTLTQTLREFDYYVLSHWKGREAVRPHREIERWFDILLGAVAFLGTALFCGGCLALCQRDLLRMLLRSFDFVFLWVQITLFGVCLCDMVEWDADRTLVIGSWVVWFHWVLSLDALTPVVRYKVLGFSRRFITPILLLSVVVCVGGFYRVVFLSISGFENRVIWEYNISTTQTIEVQTEELFLGCVSFILLWCSRRLYMLLIRGTNELFVLHGRVDLATTRTSVMASFSRIIKVFPVLKSTKWLKGGRGGWLGNSGDL